MQRCLLAVGKLRYRFHTQGNLWKIVLGVRSNECRKCVYAGCNTVKCMQQDSKYYANDYRAPLPLIIS